MLCHQRRISAPRPFTCHLGQGRAGALTYLRHLLSRLAGLARLVSPASAPPPSSWPASRTLITMSFLSSTLLFMNPPPFIIRGVMIEHLPSDYDYAGSCFGFRSDRWWPARPCSVLVKTSVVGSDFLSQMRKHSEKEDSFLSKLGSVEYIPYSRAYEEYLQLQTLCSRAAGSQATPERKFFQKNWKKYPFFSEIFPDIYSSNLSGKISARAFPIGS